MIVKTITKWVIILALACYIFFWFIAPTVYWDPETYISDQIEDQVLAKSCSDNHLFHTIKLSRELFGLVPVTHRVVIEMENKSFTFNQKFFFLTIGKWEYECKQGGFRREVW